MRRRPIVGISMGDPAGVGPEIIAAALDRDEVRQRCRPVVIGSVDVMRRAVGFASARRNLRRITDPAIDETDAIDVFEPFGLPSEMPAIGVVSAAAGDSAFRSVVAMIELALAGQLDATVTAPIHKEAIAAAGHDFPGHTEIFAHYTKTADYSMMLAAGEMRVVHVSTHVSLRQACDAVKRPRVLAVIRLAHEACRRLGITRPLIGVAGLNPHASDGGLFGTEEREEIIPAIADARAAGMMVEGPQPPDTFFAKAVAGAYDVCVAMYHDQGHIPVKMTGFKYDAKHRRWADVRGINVSLGLPIIRTSVDHGTAFDQAGQGTASDASLIEAIEYAVRLAESRHR